MASTAVFKYTGAFVSTPGNIRQRDVTRADGAAGDITALGTAQVAVIYNADGTTAADKQEILDASGGDRKEDQPRLQRS